MNRWGKWKVLEFYVDSKPECEETRELLEGCERIESTRINALDDSNLRLIDEYNICMVPTVIVLNNNYDGTSLHGLKEIRDFTLLLEQL